RQCSPHGVGAPHEQQKSRLSRFPEKRSPGPLVIGLCVECTTCWWFVSTTERTIGKSDPCPRNESPRVQGTDPRPSIYGEPLEQYERADRRGTKLWSAGRSPDAVSDV